MKKISTNFFEIILSKNSLVVPYLILESQEADNNKDKLNNLRSDNPDAIFAHSREKVFYWGDNTFNQINQLLIEKGEEKFLFLKFLAESTLKQFFNDREKFRIKKDFHTYIITCLDEDVSKGRFNGLNLFKRFHIHFTSFEIDKEIRLGITVSTSISVETNWKRQDFIDNEIVCDDLRFDEDTEEAFNISSTRHRLENHFDYSSRLKNDLDTLNSIQNEFQDINGFVKKYFEENKDTFVLPNDLKIKEFRRIFYNFNSQQGSVENKLLEVPECFFYQGAFRSGNPNNRKKIGYNKPFTYDDFENKEIKIKILVPKQFITKTQNFFSQVKQELADTFKIKVSQIKADGKQLDDFSLESYQNVLNEIDNVDLVVVVITENHESLSPNDSPYYFCKAEFIKRGINTQEVQIQQIEKFLLDKKANITNYTDHNIALNIYAKLGGMGWTVKPNDPKNELIIGIGATTDKEGQPILGLTSVFRGDGKYLFGKVSSVTGMRDYRKNLEEILSEIVQKNIDNGTLEVENPVHLLFHIFKSAGKDNEIKALENVVKKFADYSFEYSYIHIGEGHNYRFFTFEENNNAPKFEMKRGLGQNQRGTLIKINDRLGFLCLRPNSSTFIKIEIDERSNFFDLEYIANQVYQFAEMSHTSYNKSGKPVTIKYPNLMADFAIKFSEIDGFYPKEIKVLDNSLWFI